MQATLDVRLQSVPNVLGNGRKVEPLWIKVSAAPMLGFGVLRIFGVVDNRQELLITRNATDVFGRPSTGPIKAGCMLGSVIEKKEFFELDRVVPIVTEIIYV